MNYKKIYNKIISERRNHPINDEYTEYHHIIPKSLGGSDDKTNLVALTAREHFICHLLLTKMFNERTVEWIKMIKAFNRMFYSCKRQNRYSNNKWYGYLKKNFSEAQSLNQNGSGNSQYGKVWISNIELRQTKSIHKKNLQNYIDDGWIVKRIMKWDNYVINSKNKYVYDKTDRIEKHNKTKEKKKEQKEYYTKLYQIYCEYGFKKMVEITGYKFSKQNFVQCLERHVDNFISQNRKKRGKRNK